MTKKQCAWNIPSMIAWESFRARGAWYKNIFNRRRYSNLFMILLRLWECLFQQTEILSNCLLILGYNKLLLQRQRRYVTVLQYLWMESVFTVELFHRLYSELLMTDYTNLLWCYTVPYTLLKHNKHHQNTVNIVNKRPTSVKRKHGLCWQGDLAKPTKR